MEYDTNSNIIHFLLFIFEQTKTCPAHSSVKCFSQFYSLHSTKGFWELLMFPSRPCLTQHATVKMPTVFKYALKNKMREELNGATDGFACSIVFTE